MTDAEKTGRPNQRRRTRKDLLEAATRLMRQGVNVSLEAVAEEALVSRATAYRYFPSIEALLMEAALDVAIPSAEQLFGDGAPQDPLTRVEAVDTALHDMILANEAPLRMMLIGALERSLRGEADSALPARQNRRTPLIEAALAPSRETFDPDALDVLSKALALIVGTEAMVVCKDVLQLDDAEARAVKRWAIGAMVDAAMNPLRD